MRLHPWHFSSISWQMPPLKEHPFADMKGHDFPCLTVVQSIVITPFLRYFDRDPFTFAAEAQRHEANADTALRVRASLWQAA